MTHPCLIFGAGGHAFSVSDVLERLGIPFVGVVGSAVERIWHVPVIENDAEAVKQAQHNDYVAVLGIGGNGARLRIYEQLAQQLALPAVIAPSATIAATASLGDGTVVLNQAHVGPGTQIAEAVIVNTGAIVEHDCTIGAGGHIAPGSCLLGAVTVGQRAFIGSGARVLPGVNIGDDAVVGAGAVVTQDVPANTTVVGVPARIGRQHG